MWSRSLSALAIIFGFAPLTHAGPETVEFPNRRARYMTLAGAISIALEHGDRGRQVVSTPIITGGFPNVANGGRAASSIASDLDKIPEIPFTDEDPCRVFALDLAIIEANIGATLARFEKRWILSLAWTKTGTATNALPFTVSSDPMEPFSIPIYKPLPTGGFAADSVYPNTSKLAQRHLGFAVINRCFQPSLNFSFEQLLLSDYGIEINDVLAEHPISPDQLSPFKGRPNGILIQRLRSEQQRPDFDREINVILFNVESAYWTLYANYLALYAQEQGLRQTYMTWQMVKSRHDAGKKDDGDLDRVRATIAQFRRQRIDAMEYVVESERQFRGLLGLPAEDDRRIVPTDVPTRAPCALDWDSSLSEAIANRPELVVARQKLRANQMKVKNCEKSSKTDGSDDSTPLELNTFNKFNHWSFLPSAPISPPEDQTAQTPLRAARLKLARSVVALHNQELKAERFLAAIYQNLVRHYRDIEAYQEQRQALGLQLKALNARSREGKDPLTVPLTAQTQFAEALSNEYASIASYNITLAGIQYAKGTIQKYNSVLIADGGLPKNAFTRAREYYKQKGNGVVARDRAFLPAWDTPPSLTRLLENAPPILEMPAE